MRFIENRARRIAIDAENDKEKKLMDVARKDDRLYRLPTDVKLTDEQKKVIDEFWKKYEFLGKIDYTPFEVYYNRSGIFDPRYIPHHIAKCVVRPAAVPKAYLFAFQNKAYLPKLLSNAKQPRTITRRVEGIYYNEKFEKIDIEEAADLCLNTIENGREIVIKPSGQAGGKGVEFFAAITREELLKKLKSKGKLFVVQEAIHQHPEMAALNASTVNTVRLTTFMFKGEFIPLAALIKIGSPNVRVDNYKHGGCLLGVNLDGTVFPWAQNIDRERITELPSGVKLGEGGFTKVPAFDSVLATAEKAHYDIPRIKLISWDIAIDDEGEAEIIEANFGGDQRMHQCLTGPLFGDLTEKILDNYGLKQFCKKAMTTEFDYEEFFDHIRITKYVGKKPNVVVPSEIDGKPVTSIGTYAFGLNNKILSIKLPDSITSFGRKAFYACTRLSKLDMCVENLKFVDKMVVEYCPKLDINLKNRIKNKR